MARTARAASPKTPRWPYGYSILLHALKSFIDGMTFHDDLGLLASYLVIAVPASIVAFITGTISAYLFKGNH